MSELNKQTFDAIVQLGRATADAKYAEAVVEGGGLGAVPYAVVPNDAHLESLEKYLYNDHNLTPERIKAHVAVHDPESFIEYYTKFSDPNSRIFADEPNLQVTGILDYHAAGEGSPRWCQHRLTLTLRESEEWKIWIASNNKQFSQMQFAEFLEQNSMDIITPAPAAMIEVARDLEAHTEVEFAAGARTQDGQVRFKYSEQTKATVGGGSVAVPEQFTIFIPVFVGGQSIGLQALLRFRIKEGKLVLWYTLLRPEQVRRDAFLRARNQIADALKITVINGVA